MIDRRSFLTRLSASAVLAGVPSYGNEYIPQVQGSRVRISLNGEWQRRLDGLPYGTVTVPSSIRPSGYYTLHRAFMLPKPAPGQRSFVHFEAITYWGRVTINGKVLGTLAPYVPCEFEFTDVEKVGENDLQVEIVDLTPLPDGSGKPELALGVNPGWEAYGGIIRDVWAESRSAAFIENVRLAYLLSEDYGACNATPSIMIASAAKANGEVEIVLSNAGTTVAQASKTVPLNPGLNAVDMPFTFKDPALWSPETPNLYELTATLKTASGEDSWFCKTGFRDIRAVGREFRLNGKRLVLNGVCRHDMWREQGFTLSRTQQEQDMRMIKFLGCNFVRLVHYPHDRRIVELADQLGLLVSEEPGYWNMDFTTMERPRVELGLTILETTIRRDWNSPSVMAWLLSNECEMTEAYLKEGKQRCNQLDPIKRLVSAANSRDAKKVKAMFVSADMDFFDQHPYTYDVEDFAKEAEFDGSSKPLTFTEWGGKAIGQSPLIMQNSVDRLMDLVESGELSGHMFWSWQDMRQYSRIDREMRDGILESGVVTEAREPRELVYMELARLFEMRRHAIDLPDTAPEIIPLRWSPWSNKNTFEPVDLQPLAETPDAARAWSSFKVIMAKYWANIARTHWKRTGEDLLLWPQHTLEIGGVEFQFPVVNRRVRPLVLTPEVSEILIPVDRPCLRLHILGQVTFTEGFPLVGKDGDKIATYTLEYANGRAHEIPLRNGYEVAEANLIHDAGRLDPITTEAQRGLIYVKDIAREQYQILLLSIPVEAGLMRIRCKLNGEQPPFAIFAVTAEQS